jgi:RNA polymerase sigma factor (sigma-70 family)
LKAESLKDIINGCQRQDRQAQTLLYNIFKGRLMGLGRRYATNRQDIEDIYQEAFVNIFKKINQLQKQEALESWIKRIFIGVAIDHFRKKNLKITLTDIEEGELVPFNESIFDKMSLDEIVSIIQTLPDGYRLIINLYLIDGYEHHEIAEMLNINIGTSKSQLSRAKTLLQKKIIAKNEIIEL